MVRKKKPETVQDVAKEASNKIGEILKDFIHRTGHVISRLDLTTDVQPNEKTGFNISQSLNCQYGIPEETNQIVRFGG